MTVNTKTILQILSCSIGIAIVAVFVARFVVIPIQSSISDKACQINELNHKVDLLTEKLEDAEKGINTEIYTEWNTNLIKYITANSVVLSDDMIKNAAAALIAANKKHCVSLSLMVGIAQATSGFNTTYLSSEGHRGILSLSPIYIEALKATKRNAYVVSSGADMGATVLNKVLKKGELREALRAYFDDDAYFSKYESAIYKHSIEYLCYDARLAKDK